MSDLDRKVAEALGWKLFSKPTPRHWACDALLAHVNPEGDYICPDCQGVPNYSTNWSQGGPLIEKYRVDLWYSNAVEEDIVWAAQIELGEYTFAGRGPTPLIAACRALVVSKGGDDV